MKNMICAAAKISIILFILNLIISPSSAGTWSDNFERAIPGPPWRGDVDNFSILDGALQGRNAHPILILPLVWVEVGQGWDNYVIQCRINVAVPNLLECTKGALVLRHGGSEGYVFALHVATKTAEVYRLSNGEMLLSKDRPLELDSWYQVRAELQGDEMSFYVDGELVGKLTDKRSASGSVGLAVQDALSVLFDDFSITGPNVDPEMVAVEAESRLPIAWGRIKMIFR